MITIRQANINDKIAIFEFLKKAFPENWQYKFPERWEWQFINNPFNDHESLPIYIAVDEDGTVAGQSCAMYEMLKVGDQIYRLAWALDAFVLPQYRGRNLGYETLRINCESNDLWMGLIMAESSRHILTKLGCKPVDTVSIYKRLVWMDTRFLRDSFKLWIKNRKCDHLLERIFTFFHFDQFFQFLFNLGIWIKDISIGRTRDPAIEIKLVDRFDENADILWQKISSQFPVIIQRDSHFLNWKYVEQPHMDYKLFIALCSGDIRGYMILRKTRAPESNSGIIADLFVAPYDNQTIRSLLAFAVKYFKEMKVNFIHAATTTHEYKKNLIRFGFKEFKRARPLLHSNSDSPINEIIFKSENWFLGRSDHDWDQYPYA